MNKPPPKNGKLKMTIKIPDMRELALIGVFIAVCKSDEKREHTREPGGCAVRCRRYRSDMPSLVHLRIECACLFVLWPAAALFLEGMSKFAIFAAPLLYAIAVYMRARPARPAPTWAWRTPAIRFMIAIPILIMLSHILAPEWWLAFPRERPALWALVMLAYPFFSAWPQEFLYRRFFFWRYEPLFGEGAARTAINAILFGWLHVMYDNWPAVALSALGGVVFATTYARSHNLALVWIEHALYGQVLFTIGLGRFFYEGPV